MMKKKDIASLLFRSFICSLMTTTEFAKVEGPHRLLCLKNSSKLFGQYVLFSAVAQYSSFHPASTINVQNHRSSPVLTTITTICLQAQFKEKNLQLWAKYMKQTLSVFRVILVRIFSHLDWIREYMKYLSAFSQNAGKYGQE